MKKNIKIISSVLMITLIITSCSVIFPTQKMIDSILKNNDKHAYSISDLIPFNENELKNARSLYGMELNEYYNNNVNADLSGEDLKAFQNNLIYMGYNYNILLERYDMYTKDEESYNLCKDEFDQYYKLKDTKAKSLIKSTNKDNLSGAPNISIMIDMQTLKDYGIYSEAEAEVFEHITIPEDQYNNLKFGDSITLSVPATNSTIGAKDMIKKTFTYVATNSIVYKEVDEDGLDNTVAYFITNNEPLNNTRDITDSEGKIIEVYRGRETLQFMKYAVFSRAVNPEFLYQRIVSKRSASTLYRMNDFAIKAQTGGYLVEEYKDYIYANTVYTNLKGYITQFWDFYDLTSNIDYLNEYKTIQFDERNKRQELIEKKKEEENERRNREQEEKLKQQELKFQNIIKAYEELNKATNSEAAKKMLDSYDLTEIDLFGEEGHLDKIFSGFATNSEIE